MIPEDIVVSGVTTPSGANGTYTYQGILFEFPYWKNTSGYYVYNDTWTDNSRYWEIDNDTDDAASSFFSNTNSDNPSPVKITSWGLESGTGTPKITYYLAEIEVTGNDIVIYNGETVPETSNNTAMGSAYTTGATITKIFTINNLGSTALSLTGASPYISVTGTNSADFLVCSTPSSSIAVDGSTTFDITFDPSGTGLRTATISMANNDSNENPFTFNIQGTGLNTPPSVSSVSVPASDTYVADQNLDFTINFSKNVTVTTTGGTPQLSLTIGSTTQQAEYISGSGTSALLFRYTVQSGDLDTDGITVGIIIRKWRYPKR